MNYLGNFLQSTAEVCNPIRRPTSTQGEWMWNSTYQKLYESVKYIIKKGTSITCYNEKGQPHLETDVSDVGSRGGLAGKGQNAVQQGLGI